MATTGTTSIEARIKAQETKLKQLKAQKQQIGVVSEFGQQSTLRAGVSG